MTTWAVLRIFLSSLWSDKHLWAYTLNSRQDPSIWPTSNHVCLPMQATPSHMCPHTWCPIPTREIQRDFTLSRRLLNLAIWRHTPSTLAKSRDMCPYPAHLCILERSILIDLSRHPSAKQRSAQSLFRLLKSNRIDPPPLGRGGVGYRQRGQHSRFRDIHTGVSVWL